ncbi:hypothetical protein CF635_003517 [Enterobacter hormaechei]|nr:hypothetical protein [Enterobacter hormaechei]
MTSTNIVSESMHFSSSDKLHDVNSNPEIKGSDDFSYNSPVLNKIKDTLQDLYIQIKQLFDKLFSGSQSDKAREIINSDKMATNIAEMKRKASELTASATVKNAWGQIGGALGGVTSKGVGLCVPKARVFTDMFSEASTSIIPASVAMDANSLTREASSMEISAGYATSVKDSYMKNSNATENMAKYRQLSVELDRMLTELHGALGNAMTMK